MKQIILAIALVGGLVSTAAADPGAPGRQGQCGQENREMRGEMREQRVAKRHAKRMRFERRMMALRRFDANQDGWLSPEEQRAAREAFKAKRQARREARARR